MSLEDAIEKLRAYYVAALATSWVRSQVAWALYQTWKAAAAEANREVSRA